MESKNLQFKTNLNCSNCVSKVQADLDIAAAEPWRRGDALRPALREQRGSGQE